MRPIAEGGTAEVHLAFDTWAEEWRAVKTLLPEYAQRASIRYRFEQEAVAMRNISHPNVVRVYEAAVEAETAFLVMDFIEGGSIIEWVERHGPMPERMAVQAMLDVCAGLQAAHAEGIVHRDVKPQNVLVHPDGHAMITDFGIAQVIEAQRMTATGTVMGTIGYMAPEQHESAKHADVRSDVYSVGATLFTLVTGELPTHLFMANDEDFDRVSDRLRPVLLRCTEYKPDDRFQALPELSAALREVLQKAPALAFDTPDLLNADRLRLQDITPPSAGEIDDAAARATVAPPVAEPTSEADPTQNTGAQTFLDRRTLTGGPTPERVARPYASSETRTMHPFALGATIVALGAFFLVLTLVLSAHGRLTRLQVALDDAVRSIDAAHHREFVLADRLAPYDLPEHATLLELFDDMGDERADARARLATTHRVIAVLQNQRRDLEHRGRTNDLATIKDIEGTVARLRTVARDMERILDAKDEAQSTFAGRMATRFTGAAR